jgi:hypothetical protein
MSQGPAGLIPPVLNPSSLYKEEARRDATRIRTYNMILNMIYNKIKAASRIPGGDKAIFYVIPELIPGTPRFDMGDAVLYIVWNLRNVGYFVEFTYPNALYVSWRMHDDVYRAVESPWTKVLNATRELVLKGEATPTTVSEATPAPSLTTPSEVVKRKSVLKKTVEFKPVGGDAVPRTTNPTILGGMYGSAPAPPPALKLPGQLSEKHVSFV